MRFAKFCPECGAPTGGAEHCPRCGAWTALADDPKAQLAPSTTEQGGRSQAVARQAAMPTYVRVPVWVFGPVLLLVVVGVARLMFPQAFLATLPFVVLIALVMVFLYRR